MVTQFIKTALILLVFTSSIQTLTFYLTEGKDRCFHDEYAQNTVIIGRHQLIGKIPHANEGVNLRVLDPSNNVILAKFTNNQEGKFTFTTKLAGKYQVCLKATDSKWVGTKNNYKYMIRLRQGDELELSTVAKQSQVSGLKQRILQLQSAQRDFIKMQDMNRENEDKLSAENLKINDRVFKATVFQTIVIMLAGMYQIYSLRKFFQKNLHY